MIDIIEDKWMPNPYPDPIDDGRWEDDGGYVAKPNHVVWKFEPKPYTPRPPYMSSPYYFSIFGTTPRLIAHPLTVAEIKYAIEKWT